MKVSPSHHALPMTRVETIVPTQVLEPETDPKFKEAAEKVIILVPVVESPKVKEMEGMVASQGKV